jgi:hypothetical protein
MQFNIQSFFTLSPLLSQENFYDFNSVIHHIIIGLKLLLGKMRLHSYVHITKNVQYLNVKWSIPMLHMQASPNETLQTADLLETNASGNHR